MLVADNDEELRSKIWKIVTWTATVLILIVAGYFIIKSFGGNPLRGTWAHDDSDMTIEIKKDNKALLVWGEPVEGKELKVNLEYTLDKTDKRITFDVKHDELDSAAETLGTDATGEDVEAAISSVLTSFYYSVDGKVLTLTEWDYGDQFLFSKMK